MELKSKTVMEGILESSYDKFRNAGNAKKKKKKNKILAKAIEKILERGRRSLS